MDVVRHSALREEFLAWAIDAPFDLREKLKKRGYRGRRAELENGKVWWTATPDSTNEIEWLQEEIYARNVEHPTHRISTRNRYADRIWCFDV